MTPRHLNFLHCNSCSLPLTLVSNPDTKDRHKPFYLTSCGHVFCNVCRASKTRPTCFACNASSPQTVELQSPMKEQVKRFFCNSLAAIDAHVSEDSRAVDGLNAVKKQLREMADTVTRVEEELKRSQDAKTGALRILKFQTDQWQRLAQQNAELWKKQLNQKTEVKKMEKRLQDESAKAKAHQSKLKEKARSKILELQGKVENLRAVLKKVSAGESPEAHAFQHLLDTPAKSTLNRSDSVIWGNASYDDSMNATPPQLTSTPRSASSSRSNSMESSGPQVPLLSTPLSPKSRRRVSPIKPIPGDDFGGASTPTPASNRYSTPSGQRRPNAPTENADSASAAASSRLKSMRQSSTNSAFRTPERNAGQSGYNQRTPMGDMQNTLPRGSGRVNSSGKSRRDSGFSDSGGSRNSSSNCENLTPRFLSANLMSPYFLDRKRNA